MSEFATTVLSKFENLGNKIKNIPTNIKTENNPDEGYYHDYLYIIKIILYLYILGIVIVYMSMIFTFIDKKRASYSSINKDNNTEASMGHIANLGTYGGTTIDEMNMVLFALYMLSVICLIIYKFYSKYKIKQHLRELFQYLFKGIEGLKSDDMGERLIAEQQEKEVYSTIILIIFLIISIIYFISFLYMYTYNPLAELKSNVDTLQNEIYGNMNAEFLKYVLSITFDTSALYTVDEKGNKTSVITKMPLSPDELKAEEDLIQNQFPEKVSVNIATIHNKIDEWLYKDPKKVDPNDKDKLISLNNLQPPGKAGDALTDEDKIKQHVDYRFKILMTSIILVYYMNSQNIDTVVRKSFQSDNTLKANIFLYTDSNASSILPPLSVLQTTSLYKSIIRPISNTCVDNKDSLTDTQIKKLEEKYTTCKSKIDLVFKRIKNSDDPTGHKMSIIMSIVIMCVYIAFGLQLFYWGRGKKTFLKHWGSFLMHYGKIILLVIMIILVI